MFGTFASEEERKVLADIDGILDRNLLDTRKPSYVTHLESIAGEQGFDLILSTRGPESVGKCWQNLGRGGRLVVVGNGSDMPDLGTLDVSVFLKSATLCRMDMIDVVARNPRRASR